MQEHFDALNRYFGRAFVISLERAVPRQRDVVRALSGLDFEFFLGVDKNALDLEGLERQGLVSRGKARRAGRTTDRMSVGQVACSWSHRNLYEHIVTQGLSRALVFEDDVFPIKQDISKIGAILEQLPESWELLYLGYLENDSFGFVGGVRDLCSRALGSLGICTRSAEVPERFRSRPYSENLRFAGFHYCTHAYAVSLRGAQKLLECQTPIAFVADSLLSHLVVDGKLEAYISVPKMFSQDFSDSYLNDRNLRTS